MEHGGARRPVWRRRLRRVEGPGHARYLTFSTVGGLPLLGVAWVREFFAIRLEAARVHYGFRLFAWVVMPEHVHLLLRPRLPEAPARVILNGLKSGFARLVIASWRAQSARVLPRLSRGPRVRFWLPGGGYDRNIYSPEEFVQKVRHIHENPVRRGLCRHPEDWRWSSGRWYRGDRSGPVQIDPWPL